MRKVLALLFCLFTSPALAGVSCTLPFTLTNGTIADASQVMANYNALTACLLNAAQAGNNTDITALNGLTTPLAHQFGGTATYTGGTSSGTNTQTVTTVPTFIATAGNIIVFKAGGSNTGPMTLNGINVYRRSQLGATMTVGGEVVAGQTVTVQYDGVEFQCVSCGNYIVGEARVFLGPVPAGWLLLDGSCQLQSTYADLYSVVGNAPGGSCSSGSFALFDGRGSLLAGLDNQGSNGNAARLSTYCTSTTLGETCGAQNQTLAQANLGSAWTFALNLSSSVTVPSCNNTIASGPGSCTSSSSQPTIMVSSKLGDGPALTTYGENPSISVSGTAATGGSDTPFETVQPTLMVYTAVKY